MQPQQALNALTTVALSGLFDNDAASPSPATIVTRKDMPVDLIKPIIVKYGPKIAKFYTDITTRRPSTQPPPESGRLEASLGEYLGHGHSSVVFSLDNVNLFDVTPAVVPPLVVKIARLNRVTSLMREAWFYDEMECLQGASLARCYGYFEVELHEDPEKTAIQTALRQLASKYPSSDSVELNPVLERDRECGPLHPLAEDRAHRNDVLALLVLERLGSSLPIGKPVSQETR